MPATTTPARESIAAANRRFTEAFRNQDAAGIAALYTSSGSVLPPGGEPMEGPDAIRAFWAGAFDMGFVEAVLETQEVEGDDRFAWEVGRYAMKTGDGRVADRGKYVVIWRHDGDRWMIHRDIWNSSGS
jgi:uncharacterized protein (TIGR02246 family)